jgi:hypothetical protein
VYFAELKAGGEAAANGKGAGGKGYDRAYRAIQTLFPGSVIGGTTTAYAGNLSLFQLARIRTEQGGSINILAPGGGVSLGIENQTPNLTGQTDTARPGLLTAPTTPGGVRQLLRALKQGECVGLLPDQVPPEGQGLWLPFLGRDAYTMTLAARLAQQTGASVLLAWGERLAMGRGYRVHVRPLPAPLTGDTGQAAAQINRAIEGLILACPAQYLWGYARFKQPRQAA